MATRSFSAAAALAVLLLLCLLGVIAGTSAAPLELPLEHRVWERDAETSTRTRTTTTSRTRTTTTSRTRTTTTSRTRTATTTPVPRPWQWDQVALLTHIEGNVPIVVTAPHGGTGSIPDGAGTVPERNQTQVEDFVTTRDSQTDRLAELVFENLLVLLNPNSNIDPATVDLDQPGLLKPHLAIARFARKFCDANRPPGINAYENEAAGAAYASFHGAIASAVAACRAASGTGLLADLHGQNDNVTAIFRGTQDGRTVSALLAAHGPDALAVSPSSVFGSLESQGVSVIPAGSAGLDETKFAGGWIVQRYGSQNMSLAMGHDYEYDPATGATGAFIAQRPPGIDAVQLELGSDFRLNGPAALADAAAKVAAALFAHYEAYLA
ncbi:hypothetical protein DFJ74DRAFT_751094, partial [Hyaloraphidium curvatum]